jgi:error-prone DNA polymerase
VLPVDVNASEASCTVEGRAIRIGLGYVKGIRDEEAAAIALERVVHGPYRSLADLLRRVAVRREIVERLVMVGALDWTGLRRRELLWQFGLLQPPVRVSGQGPDAVQQLGLELPIEQDMVELSPLSAWDKMRSDYEILGLSAHWQPMLLLRSQMSEQVLTAAQINAAPHGGRVQVAGLVVCRQRPSTAKGVTFLLLEDETGLANVVIHQGLYERERLTLRTSPVMLIEGRLERQGDAVNIVARQLIPIPVEPPPPEREQERTTQCKPRLVVAAHDYR